MGKRKRKERSGGPVVHVLGLGPGPADLLTLRAMELLAAGGEVLVRTSRHPCVERLRERGVRMRFLDHCYREAATMEEAYRRMAEEVMRAAEERGTACYAVPGHPLVAERSVRLLMDSGVELRLHPAVSFLDAFFSSLRCDPLEGMLLVDGERLAAGERAVLDPRVGVVIAQVDSRMKASDVKLCLLEVYPPGHETAVVTAAGDEGERVEWIPLEELDRGERFDHLTTIYVPPLRDEEIYDFRRLQDVVARLRGPGGCPWDRRQTHETLARHMVEEAHEAVDAIRQSDWEHLAEELGDLLLQIMLHAQMAREAGEFDIRDVIRGISTKLIRRHPHVFGESKATDAEEVALEWEELKQNERKEGDSLLSSVPLGLPALSYSHSIQRRAAGVGFDWKEYDGILDKLVEELRELKHASTHQEKVHEFGDILFALVNAARWQGVDPEEALRLANERFSRRFRYMEEVCRNRGMSLRDLSFEEQNALWEEAKQNSAY